MSTVIAAPSVPVTKDYYIIAELTRLNPPANSTTVYIPDSGNDNADLIDVRNFSQIAVMIESDQAIGVYIQNSPDGSLANAKDLAGYEIPSGSFDTTKRNKLMFDAANSLLGYIRVRVETGASAPTSVKVWVIAR